MKRSRLVLLVVAAIAVDSPAVAQRDPFYSSVVAFYRSLPGFYGDEGPQLTAQLAAMSTALERWDRDISDAERELRSQLQSVTDVQSTLQIHTTLASLYMERGRLRDAGREFDADIRLDPRRAAFHRLKGLVLQAESRHAEAADAFRMAWLLDPGDPQNAYRVIAARSAMSTPAEIDRARQTLGDLERELIRRQHPGMPAPFTNVSGIHDDAGGGMAFVPRAYAAGFSLILHGELRRGVAELSAAAAADPLVNDPALRSDETRRGIAALRRGDIPSAIDGLEAALARARESSEAHRLLAGVYAIDGRVAASVRHLREAVRLNPRDERSWLALARTLTTVGRTEEVADVLRGGLTELPDASVLRWRLSTRVDNDQDADDLAFIDMAEQLVLFVGKGELYRAIAGLAQLYRDDATAIGLLQRAVRLTPNNATAHKALGRAYVDNGRDDEGYAELVIALLLHPGDVETLTALGRWHLTVEQPARAVEALERAVELDPANRFAIHALAGALLRVGRATEGRQHLRASERLQAQAIEGDRRGKAAAVLGFSAEMRMAEGDLAGAVDSLRQALRLEPGHAGVHLRLADAMAAAGRGEDAVTEYRAAISLEAGADAHRRLAEVLDSLGRHEEAERERGTHVERRLEDLRQRAEHGAYGF